MLRGLRCFLIICCGFVLGAQAKGSDLYAELLAKYVTPAGVHYAAWSESSEDLAALERVLDGMATVVVDDLSDAEQKAFYINLYNAAMLQAVFDHYPLESVKEIGEAPFSIFKRPFIRQGERLLSLDDVEKGILLKEYFDPRIHFAVNCASESCPPLLEVPYTGESLEKLLEQQTRLFAASDRAARVDLTGKRVLYSSLLNWYQADFGVQNPAEYLNRYREEALPVSFAVDWIEYDWALNSVMRP